MPGAGMYRMTGYSDAEGIETLVMVAAESAEYQ